jgi:hypothetical protein
MGWEEPTAEIAFAGTLSQYVGQTLELVAADQSFEVRWEDDRLGRLTRPEQAMVAETREGRWELRRPRRSIARIDMVDAHTAAAFARYKRRVLRPGTVTTNTASYRLHNRTAHPEWTLADSSGTKLVELRPSRGDAVLDVAVLAAPAEASDLGPLAMLAAYVQLMSGPVGYGGGGPDALPF